MKYLARIRQLLAGLARAINPSEEDRIWNAWLDVDKKREVHDLQRLLISDVRMEFRIRALIVLLAPDLYVLPFRWDDIEHSLRNYLFVRWFEVKAFPREIVSFAGELICQNIDYVLGEPDDTKLRGALFEYNRLILQFLALLSEDDDLARRLFSRYQINDSVAFMNIEDASGYNPLLEILCTEDIPMKWKWLADKQMRDIIVDEIEEHKQPRADWERALPCYIHHIQMCNYDGRESYSRELLVSQIRFITELSGIENYDRELFSSWQVVYIMEAMYGDDFHEIRHKLARLVVLRKTEEHSKFSVWDSRSRRAAHLMLREFRAEDKELATKLSAMLAEANRREAEKAEAEREQERKVNDVLNQMK